MPERGREGAPSKSNAQNERVAWKTSRYFVALLLADILRKKNRGGMHRRRATNCAVRLLQFEPRLLFEVAEKVVTLGSLPSEKSPAISLV
jgi:hypothetical protein